MRAFLAALLLAAAPAGAETLNTLDFFITKHPDKGLNGAHPLSQTIIGDRSYYVKWQPGAFEMHRIDGKAGIIYLEEDHNTGAGAYSIVPGPWLKINMRVGETIPSYGPGHVIRYYNADCTLDKELRFDYEMTLEAHIPDYDVGGDLGKQDVIVVGYGLPGTGWERDYYSREWGWVKWEAYAGDKTTLKQVSVFNKIMDAPIRPDAQLACAAKPDPNAPGPTVPPSSPGGACPAAEPYFETRADAIARYCQAFQGVSCPGAYVGRISCKAAPGWSAYGPDCTPPSCSGCACVGSVPPTPTPTPTPTPSPGGGCPAGTPYVEQRPDAVATYCRAGGLECDAYVPRLDCDAAPGFQPYGPNCAPPACAGCACQ